MDGVLSWFLLLGLLVNTGYCSTFPGSVILNDGDTFEYIVVGAGAGGSAVAARLALADKNVLLVEAGGDPDDISQVPSAAQGLMGSNLDWQYPTISNKISCLSYRGQQCRFSRGRCLGGSTSINFMIHTRGAPQDWDQMNITGWTWKDIRPYFLKFEGLQDLSLLPDFSNPYHNTNGTMRMEFFTDPQNPWHSRIIKGFESLNVLFNPDVNAASQVGVTKVIGYVYKNKRMSTARGYLSRSDVQKRLKVAKHTRCTGVILDVDRIARGVTVAHGIFGKPLKLYAEKEVILSAGAIGTPQILMLSGIGPADHLKEHSIAVKIDLPVGNNMTDHLLPLAFVKVDGGSEIEAIIDIKMKALQLAQLLILKKGPLTSNGLTDVTAFFNTKCYDFETRQLRNFSAECNLPSVQYIHAYIDRGLAVLGGSLFQQGTDLNDDVTEQLRTVNKNYGIIVVSPLVLQPKSVGKVRLASSDPLQMPAIYPNYLSDDSDMNEMVRSLQILEHLVDTPIFKHNNASIVRLALDECPPYEAGAEEYWRCYSRHMTHTTYHAVGTAALGRVVDGALRVLGARRLRVADLGVLPSLPRGNTAASAIAVGERLADMILNPAED